MRRIRPTLRVELPAPGNRDSTTVAATPRLDSSTASARPAIPPPTMTLRIDRQLRQRHRTGKRARPGWRGVDAHPSQSGEHGGGAELALTRAGHCPGPPLDQLRMAEALLDALPEVPHAHVLAQAGKS